MSTLTRVEPQQARAERTLDGILKAGREVLDEVGRDRLTTALVADRAGCSIGTFYRYFVDRVALLDTIQPLRVARVLETAEDVAMMPRGTVLLCRAKEVFWLPPAPVEASRLWLAAGYSADQRWNDSGVADWGPLIVLHVGTEGEVDA
jgi:AcrR family transcriptional regulator